MPHRRLGADHAGQTYTCGKTLMFNQLVKFSVAYCWLYKIDHSEWQEAWLSKVSPASQAGAKINAAIATAHPPDPRPTSNAVTRGAASHPGTANVRPGALVAFRTGLPKRVEPKPRSLGWRLE